VKCAPLPLDGAHLLTIEPAFDVRGYYATTWCAREVRAFGLNDRIVQTGTSLSLKRGTVRGMHMQAAPYAQAKFVRCTKGSLHDVIIDLRKDSPTYCKWTAVELSMAKPEVIYVPEGFAHGLQTLEDHTEVSYQMTEYYHPGSERGVRWNDPLFAISWPIGDVILSDKDKSYADFKP
jgi:dTDP-4-dehydrorhamnose 3,5-epimerase